MLRWGGRPVWRVLDPHFGDGDACIRWCSAWQHDPDRPRLLHCVGIAPALPDVAALHARLVAAGLAAPAERPAGLLPGASAAGFHRLELAAGRILLTLCIGPLLPMLRAQQFLADTIDLRCAPDALQAPPWDLWAVKALARLCRRGTALWLPEAVQALPPSLVQAGFRPDPESAPSAPAAVYQPAWEPGSSRAPWRAAPPAPSHCVVLGAGLAGAAVAAALARRHWAVSVLDRQPHPAAAASGLPAGLIVPQPSHDDAPRSRLSRAGVTLTLQWCRRLLREGEDWACTGVRQHLPDTDPRTTLWHPEAGWIRPARLVAACLSQPGVQFQGAAAASRLQRRSGEWLVLDSDGLVLAQAPHVVLALAGDSPRLVRQAEDPAQAGIPLGPMPEVQGQVSWGLRRDGDGDGDAFPSTPVNGDGHLLPAIPVDGGCAWFAGATYEPGAAAALDVATAHAQNLQRLARLLPHTAQALAPCFHAGQVHHWRGSRATTRDRLPGVGALQDGASPSLWLSAGMGSRGLTYAVLCAELLAARLGGEPLPVDGRLAGLLCARRRALSDHQ